MLTSNTSNVISNELTKTSARAVISGATACTADAVHQGINIAMGNQEEFNLKQTVMAGTVSSITITAFEGVRGGMCAQINNNITNENQQNIVENNLNREVNQREVVNEEIESLKDQLLKEEVWVEDAERQIAQSETETMRASNQQINELLGNSLVIAAPIQIADETIQQEVVKANRPRSNKPMVLDEIEEKDANGQKSNVLDLNSCELAHENEECTFEFVGNEETHLKIE